VAFLRTIFAACRYKDKGNTLYKNKSFEEAVAMYTKAYDAHPANIAVLTNRAAVKFEQKDYDACIADCKKAIDEGRTLRADFKIIARAYERMGNALAKKDQLKEAIDAYNNSLVENRVKEVEKKARELEKELKRRAEEAYQDPAIAAQEKEKGNALVKEGNFVEAKAVYDEAIRRNPKDHTLYSNRALCFMKLLAWPQAKQDCDKALDIDPKFVRALERRGNCHIMLKEHTKALADFKKGLELDPTNAGCLQGAHKVEQQMFSGNRDPEAVANAMKDPEIQQILQDPMINNVLRNLQGGDLKAGQDALKDPVIAERIQKLAAAGILSFG
jgi:stress-induced-phosphoprotein 1